MPGEECVAACGKEFRAFDGPQKCGRVKGHPGAHTRDPLPSDRRAFDVMALREREGMWGDSYEEAMLRGK